MITVIIPTLNEEKYLPRLLRDLRQQSFRPKEVIVVDAGSKDNTINVANKHRAKVRIGPKNTAKQRNMGGWMSKNKWLLFLDADMRLPDKNTIKKLIKAAKHDIGATPSTTLPPKDRTLMYRIFVEPANLSAKLFPSYATRGGCILIRRDIFKKLNGFNEHMAVGEDLDLGARAKKYGKFKVAPVYVYEDARRYKKEGILKVVAQWWINGLWCKLFSRSYTKEWKAIR